jgi:hypothetical protein
VLQVIAAIISAAVPVDGGRGWTSFGLLLFELNLIVWAGRGSQLLSSAALPFRSDMRLASQADLCHAASSNDMQLACGIGC